MSFATFVANTPLKNRSITDFVKRDCAYFGMKLGDQDDPWDPHIMYKT